MKQNITFTAVTALLLLIACSKQGNPVYRVEKQWEVSSKWVNSGKFEYTYDDNGNKIQEIGYTWDKDSSQWIKDNKREFTYNVNGNRTQAIIYSWDERYSKWGHDKSDFKYKYTYDDNGNKTQEILYTWNEDSSQWIKDFKSKYIYKN